MSLFRRRRKFDAAKKSETITYPCGREGQEWQIFYAENCDYVEPDWEQTLQDRRDQRDRCVEQHVELCADCRDLLASHPDFDLEWTA